MNAITRGIDNTIRCRPQPTTNEETTPPNKARRQKKPLSLVEIMYMVFIQRILCRKVEGPRRRLIGENNDLVCRCHLYPPMSVRAFARSVPTRQPHTTPHKAWHFPNQVIVFFFTGEPSDCRSRKKKKRYTRRRKN